VGGELGEGLEPIGRAGRGKGVERQVTEVSHPLIIVNLG
jgi:hypothetical protein